MRRMFFGLALVLTMVAPPGFIMADPTSGSEATPKISDDPEGGEQALLMNTPNCVLMADGTQSCADPISGRTLALLKFSRHNSTVALSICFRKTVRS